jgi:hypothetical protein
MRRTTIFPLAILLAATSMFGQSLTSPPRVDPSNCPVGLQVEHSSGLFTYQSAKAGPADQVKPSSEQWLDLKMTNFSTREIVRAEITVHGLSYKQRLVPVSAPAPDLWKTVEVALDVKGNGSGSSELSFGHFSNIRTVDLNSITYADGSTWHASSPGACSVAPGLIMRISAQ